MNTQTPDPTDLAIRFLDALLSSASVDTIGAANWWDRARTALETAAAGAHNAQRAVSIAAKKLQIETLTEESSRVIAEIAPQIDACFHDWRTIARTDAVYIAALVRVHRSNRKANR